MRLRVCDEESGSEAWSRRFFCSGRGQKEEEKNITETSWPIKKKEGQELLLSTSSRPANVNARDLPTLPSPASAFFFLLEACEAIIKTT